jgi:hypothetical protein
MAGGGSIPASAPLTFTEQQVALARSKSYTGHAVICLVLGCVLWLPGLIATIVFRNEAKRNEQIAGQSLPGVGCLTAMLWWYIIGFVLLFIVIVAVFGSI